jgi:hypothetical protein
MRSPTVISQVKVQIWIFAQRGKRIYPARALGAGHHSAIMRRITEMQPLA